MLLSAIIVVESFPTTIRRALPYVSKFKFSKLKPASAVTTWPFVKIAKSSKIAYTTFALQTEHISHVYNKYYHMAEKNISWLK